MTSKRYIGVALQDATSQPLRKYPYYVHLLTTSPWRVPLLQGRTPRAPTEASLASDRGGYGLFMMLLFRPHRQVTDLVQLAFAGKRPPQNEEEAWEMVYQEYIRWRSQEDALALTYRRSDSHGQHISQDSSDVKALVEELFTSELDFNTPGWWACMTSDRMRNYDTSMRKHGSDMSAMPTDVDDLPLFHETVAGKAAATDEMPTFEGVGAEGGLDFDMFCGNNDDDCAEQDERDTRAKAPVAMASRHCGVLPAGCSLSDFHLPPAKLHARNAEGRYWQGFVQQLQEASPANALSAVHRAPEPTWRVSCDSVTTALERQSQFFKIIDLSDYDPECCMPHSVAADEDAGSPVESGPTKFDEDLAAAIRKLPPLQTKSDSVVMEAAFSLLMEGKLLHVQDLGRINVKQARAFLWNAVWLQEHKSLQWRSEGHIQSDLPGDGQSRLTDFGLALMGPGGIGKTAVLKVSEGLTTFFAGPETVRKMAPSNAAARILGGDTMHSLCKLPYGKVTLSSKRGRLSNAALGRHRKKWRGTLAAYIDELSMVSADQFLQCDVRMRQGKMRAEVPFGGLAVNVCGDFLQLPPVSKDGTKKSLACALDDVGHQIVDPEDCDVVPDNKGQEAAKAESRQGHELWKNYFRRVVCLSVNVRAPGVLSRLQAEMRAGFISDEMWGLYLSRVLVPGDPRLADASSPFVKHDVTFVVHRHKIRVMRSLEMAKTDSLRLRTQLFMVQAKDEETHPAEQSRLTPPILADLLRRVSPEQTQGLPSFLPLYRGMRLLLSSKECVRLGLVKGCPVVVKDIVLSDDELLPFDLVAGQPHSLQYMPNALLLQAEGAKWTLPAAELPEGLPRDMDRKGLFLLKPSHAYLRVADGAEHLSVRRTSFHANPADTITVYAAQGATYDAIVADMQRPPNLDAARHWLACYVMISRSRSLEGFLVLRPATRKELSTKPPKYLLDELARLEELETKSLQELVDLIESLPISVPDAIRQVLEKDAAQREADAVEVVRKATFASELPKRNAAGDGGSDVQEPPRKKLTTEKMLTIILGMASRSLPEKG